jgi:AcrR family transcriptional regulator
MSTRSTVGRGQTTRMAKSDQTRGRILEAARRLFNARGTAAVSTNHIAAEAGLSPGNLYYHFAGKQEIIRALHDRYAAANQDLWEPGPGTPASLETLRAGLTRAMALGWEYRFFERELVALLRADPLLRDSYMRAYEHRLGQWLAFGEQLVAQEAIRPPRPPATLADLAVAIWLIGASWLPFLEITGDPQDPAQVARGADLVQAVLAPYLTGHYTAATQPSILPPPGRVTEHRRASAGEEPT